MGDVRVKFIDWFAGIGGFRRGMELAGHECVGFCEFDKFATASYISMHLLTDAQRKKLDELPQKKRQKEILKDEYRNGEWYANDVRRVCADDIPKADCWCFGFPCFAKGTYILTEKKILDFCRTAKGEEQEDVLAACVEANKYIAHYIFLNLITGVGYDRMSRIYFIPIQKVDFQGYRRLAMKKLRDLRFKEEEESG